MTVDRALQKRDNMLTQRGFSEKWDTHQPPDPQPLTSPFQTAFLLLSEADKFIPLVSEQSPLFFCPMHQWKQEGGSRSEGGRNTSAPQSYTVGIGLTSRVLGPLGLGVWAPLSYNTVDKKPRDQPSGNLRGGVSRPGGLDRGKEGQNFSGTLQLPWPIYVWLPGLARNKLCAMCHKTMWEAKSAPFADVHTCRWG